MGAERSGAACTLQEEDCEEGHVPDSGTRRNQCLPVPRKAGMQSFKIGGISRKPQTWISVNRGTVTVMQGHLSHASIYKRGADAPPIRNQPVRHQQDAGRAAQAAGAERPHPRKDARCFGMPDALFDTLLDALWRPALASDPAGLPLRRARTGRTD